MDTLPALLRDLPPSFRDVPYDADRYPGTAPRDELALGANSQVFAYAVLATFGISMPDLRSDELWRDTEATVVATVPNPKAALALLRRLEGFTGIAIEAADLEESAGQFEEQIDRAVEANPEISQLVRQLERGGLEASG